MRRKFLKVLIHPLLIYHIIAILECRPYHSALDQQVYLSLPKIGENFKAPNEDMVYYYSGKGKYMYSSIDCFFSMGNPSWSESLENGGIRTIDDSIAAAIPLLGDMCDDNMLHSQAIRTVEGKKIDIGLQRYFSFNYLIDNFSGLAHLLAYFLLAFSICYKFIASKFKYAIAFFGCFIGGSILEIIQHLLIIGRSGSWSDIWINSVGALLGIATYWMFNRKGFIKVF